MESIIAVVSSVLSAGLFSFIIFLIQRKDNKRNDISEIKESIKEIQEQDKKKFLRLERDGCRTQLMLLMSNFPDDVNEIMRIGEHYFVDLNGNWYATSLFNRWIERNGIEKPSWFGKE